MSVLEEANTEVVSTDVLVLGGGIAGSLAAIKASEYGASVVLVDKANAGRSGHSHMMSGTMYYFDPEKDGDRYDDWYRECVESSDWLADQKRLENMIIETGERLREMDRWGVKFLKHNGEYVRTPGVGHYYARNIIMTKGAFQMMSVLRGEVLRHGVRMIERVMVTDFLTSDGELPTSGRVVGAVGFHIRTGKFYIFKAKAIVVATGSADSIYGYAVQRNLSGDGIATAFRAGCELRNIDLTFWSPSVKDFNMSAGQNVLVGEGIHMVNAKGERFLEKWDPRRMENTSRMVIAKAQALEELEGRGPVYWDATHLDEASHNRIEGAIPIIVKNLAVRGLSWRKDKIIYSLFPYTGGPGGIRVSDREGSTTIAGLYCGGAASDHAEDGATNVINHGTQAAIGGHRAGEGAGKYVATAEEPKANESQVKCLKEQIFAPMQRDGGLGDQEVRAHCRSIYERGLIGPIKNETGLKKAVEVAGEIRSEEIPRLKAKDYHELARGIGLSNTLVFLELYPRCSLLRTESRGGHMREDYPEKDDANWLKWVIAKKGEAGIELWVEPVPFAEYPLKPESAE